MSGADLLDGTPIYDIKPYLAFTDSHPEAIGGFADAVKDYSVEVCFPDEFLSLIEHSKRADLIKILENDPRPSYIEDENRIYTFSFADYEISFTVKAKVLTVIGVEKR